jgi:RNA polymerase sigma-70 factor (ECF subfamily)
MGMREEKIIQRIKDRDAQGLEMLMNRYIGYVSAVVWGILHEVMTVQDAEEVVSDVFLAAWNQPEDLHPGKVKAWLGAVARNKAKNALRHAGQELPLEEDVLELPDGSSFERLERREQSEVLQQAIDSLGPKDREIFLRHYYYAQTISHISREMKMPEATIKTRLRRGRMKLKEYLIGRDIL